MNAHLRTHDVLRRYAPSKPRPLSPYAVEPLSFMKSPPILTEDSPPSRSRLFEGDVAIKDLQRRLSLDPDLVPQPPAPRRRKCATLLRIGSLSFVAIVLAVVGVLVLPFAEEQRKPNGRGGGDATPAREDLARARTSARPARLAVQDQKGFANEALPLGVSLNGAAGEEIVTLSGIVPGTELSAGTRTGVTRWRVPAQDVGKGFAHPPRDFVGVTDIMVDLYSRDDLLLDSQVVRLEWVKRNDAGATAGGNPKPRPAVGYRLDPETSATVEEFLNTGEILSARILLRRAAAAGSSEAALKLGMTYDPAYLAQTGATGFAGDVAQAHAWYQRAAELQLEEAPHDRERRAGVGR